MKIEHSVSYRKASVHDARNIVKINLEGWRTTYRNLISCETIEKRFLTYEKRVNKTIEQITMNNTYYVAEVNDEVVGFVQYVLSNDDKYKEHGEIKALYVKDKYHKKGIGKELFSIAINEMRKLGLHIVLIDCLVGNPANDFYLKMGTSIDSIKEENFMDEILIENVHILKL
jgi:GNAT superfamily N-acetyltransferase